MSQAAAAPATPTAKSAGTEYVVLIRDDSPGSEGRWDRIGPPAVTARSSDEAVRQVAEKRTEKGGTFVAIPVRSFKPVKVTPETRTTLKLEEAK